MRLWLHRNRERIVISMAVVALIWAIYTVWSYYSDNVGFPNRVEPCDLTAEYGQVGDFFGGILNPLLSFFSIVLLLVTLFFQIKSNETARGELHAIELESRRNEFVALCDRIERDLRNNFERLIFVSDDAPHESFRRLNYMTHADQISLEYFIMNSVDFNWLEEVEGIQKPRDDLVLATTLKYTGLLLAELSHVLLRLAEIKVADETVSFYCRRYSHYLEPFIASEWIKKEIPRLAAEHVTTFWNDRRHEACIFTESGSAN